MAARFALIALLACAGCCANAKPKPVPWAGAGNDPAADVRPSLPATPPAAANETPWKFAEEPTAGTLAHDFDQLKRRLQDVDGRQIRMTDDVDRLMGFAKQISQGQLPQAAPVEPVAGETAIASPSLFGRLIDAVVGVGLPIASGALGISFPPLLAFGAYKLLRGLGGKVLQRRKEAGAASPAEFLTAQRDGTEAHQLLELAKLEGKNPILLGYQGLALNDEIEELLRRSDQAPRAPAEIAAALRRRIEERVNQTLRPVETAVV